VSDNTLKRILVIQTAFIGDAILASSLLETIHASQGDDQIDILVRKGNETLFECHPYINNVLIWDKRGEKYRGLISLLFKIRRNRYDIVVNLQRFLATGMLTAFSRAKQRIGFQKNPLSFLFTSSFPHSIEKGIHEVDRNYSLVKSWVNVERKLPRIYPHDSHLNRVEPYLHTSFVTFSAASVWYTKQYPHEKWVELLSRIPRQHRIIALGAKGDHQFSQEILDEIPCESVINLCGELSLLESAALMKHARMNFVNDSAPLHLASAVNAPVCAIFCSTKKEFGFGPLSDSCWIIETKEDLDCRPCGLHGRSKCPEGHFNCAKTIAIEQFEDIFASL